MRYEETVFVRELNNGNGLLQVIVSPGPGVLAISDDDVPRGLYRERS